MENADLCWAQGFGSFPLGMEYPDSGRNDVHGVKYSSLVGCGGGRKGTSSQRIIWEWLPWGRLVGGGVGKRGTAPLLPYAAPGSGEWNSL